MRILICGAGQVGVSIAKQLSLEGNDVTIVDQSKERIQKINDTLDVKAIVGFASHPTVLADIGAENIDMIIAVTMSDETNVVICQVAHSLFNIPTKIARIRNQNYLKPGWMKLYRHDHIPIDYIISPEIEVANAIIDRLHVPGSVDTIPLANSVVKVIGMRCTSDCVLINNSLQKIQKKLLEINAKALGIRREDKMVIINEKTDLLKDDELFFSCPSTKVKQAMKIFGHEEKEARRVIVIGGGNVGECLVKQLESENSGVKIKLIEIDKERAEHVAEEFENTTVINGSALSQNILEEANISMAETVVAVSNNDEVNILSSVLSKKFGAERIISLINNSSYSNITSSLGIDVSISPRDITVSSVLKYIRKGRIVSAHSVCKSKAEIIEAEAVESSSVVGKKINELDLPNGIVIGNIVRNDEVINLDDNAVIRPKDHLIILSLSKMVKTVEKIFSVKFEFF